MKVEDIKTLVDDYRKNTGMCSFAHTMRMAKEYPQIIELGKEAIPVILEYLRENDGGMAIMLLLMDITKENPYTPLIEHGMAKFTVDDCRKSWLDWGVKNNYIS